MSESRGGKMRTAAIEIMEKEGIRQGKRVSWAFDALVKACGKEDLWHLDYNSFLGGWIIWELDGTAIFEEDNPLLTRPLGSRMETEAFIRTLWFAAEAIEIATAMPKQEEVKA